MGEVFTFLRTSWDVDKALKLAEGKRQIPSTPKP